MCAPHGTTALYSQYDEDYLPCGSKLWKCPWIKRSTIYSPFSSTSVRWLSMSVLHVTLVCSQFYRPLVLCHSIVFPWPFLIPLPGFRSHFQSRTNGSSHLISRLSCGISTSFRGFLWGTWIFKQNIQFFQESPIRCWDWSPPFNPPSSCFIFSSESQRATCTQPDGWSCCLVPLLVFSYSSATYTNYCQLALSTAFVRRQIVHQMVSILLLFSLSRSLPAPLQVLVAHFFLLSLEEFNFALEQHYCLQEFHCRIFLLSSPSLIHILSVSLMLYVCQAPPPLLFGGNLKKPSFLRLIVYPLLDFGGSWCPLPWLVTPNPAHAAFASIDLPF